MDAHVRLNPTDLEQKKGSCVSSSRWHAPPLTIHARRRPLTLGYPPVDAKMGRALYGWKIDDVKEFVRQQGEPYSDDDLEPEVAESNGAAFCRVITRASEACGMQYRVAFLDNCLWLTRNYFSRYRGQVCGKAVIRAPMGDCVKEFSEMLGLGEPAWHLLEDISQSKI